MNSLVFAYGSNMCSERLLDRVDSASPIGIGYLQRHQLVFHKRGADGSGKANAFYTGSESDSTWGVVFEIKSKQKHLLDRFESVGVGYETVETTIRLGSGHFVEAWVYFALAAAIEDGLKPFNWYKQFVIQGARQHGLPCEYMQFLESVDSVVDSDPSRSQTNVNILNRWNGSKGSDQI